MSQELDALGRRLYGGVEQAEPEQPPWRHHDLTGWSIVGMNHYNAGGIRLLYVAMARDGFCIKAEGLDLPGLWEELRHKARRIDRDHPPEVLF